MNSVPNNQDLPYCKNPSLILPYDPVQSQAPYGAGRGRLSEDSLLRTYFFPCAIANRGMIGSFHTTNHRRSNNTEFLLY